MAQTIDEVMTVDPIVCDPWTSVADAARLMRDHDIGDVLVSDDNGRLLGIVTDRDIVVRCIAAGIDPTATTLSQMCTDELVAVAPNSPVDTAAQLMREMAVRRLPVVEQGQAVGIITIGDLAVVREPKSALADISAAAPNT
jgi:CBS domain-containing protein